MTDFEMAHVFSDFLNNAAWKTVNDFFDKWASYWYAEDRLYIVRWREKGMPDSFYFVEAYCPKEAIEKTINYKKGDDVCQRINTL